MVGGKEADPQRKAHAKIFLYLTGAQLRVMVGRGQVKTHDYKYPHVSSHTIYFIRNCTAKSPS